MELCIIEVDLSHLPLLPRPKHSGNGNFYKIQYDIILLFGLAEFKAAIAWKENVGLLMVHMNFYSQSCQGVERRSPARIIYDPDDS